jgi:hypothetical protein
MESLFGRYFIEDFQKKSVGMKWAGAMRWLSGLSLSPWTRDKFDK